jgi:hypothetical protein
VRTGAASTAEALAFFDTLEPVDLDFMLGDWRGQGFPTGHPMDGLLEACHWRGKRFASPEDVHPLVFTTRAGAPVCVNPLFMGPTLGLAARGRLPKSARLGNLLQLLLPLLATRRSRARLRRTEYRGRVSATMIYDQLPINDVFRRLDADAVLGAMDFKGMRDPFFFVLRRERG